VVGGRSVACCLCVCWIDEWSQCSRADNLPAVRVCLVAVTTTAYGLPATCSRSSVCLCVSPLCPSGRSVPDLDRRVTCQKKTGEECSLTQTTRQHRSHRIHTYIATQRREKTGHLKGLARPEGRDRRKVQSGRRSSKVRGEGQGRWHRRTRREGRRATARQGVPAAARRHRQRGSLLLLLHLLRMLPTPASDPGRRASTVSGLPVAGRGGGRVDGGWCRDGAGVAESGQEERRNYYYTHPQTLLRHLVHSNRRAPALILPKLR